MDVILGLGVRESRCRQRDTDKQGRARAARGVGVGRRETGTWEVTVIIHARHYGHTINTDTNTYEV